MIRWNRWLIFLGGGLQSWRSASGVGTRVKPEAMLRSFEGCFYALGAAAGDGVQQIGFGTVVRAISECRPVRRKDEEPTEPRASNPEYGQLRTEIEGRNFPRDARWRQSALAAECLGRSQRPHH